MVVMIGVYPDLDKEVKVLNIILRVNVDEDHMDLEGDSKHVPLLLKELAMGKCKPAATPRVGAAGSSKADRSNLSSGLLEYDQQIIGGDSVLCKADATKFRRCTMRNSYLAQDCVDLSLCTC